ncbi:MAG: glycosyltransferase family 2 protein [Ilumatobacteraceae bacterium]
MGKPTIAVLVVAYNAQDTLETVLDRIPESLIPEISTVLVCDDASTDATTAVVTNYMVQSRLPITVVTHPINRGYGGNQKFGYRWAIEHGIDVVILLHGDGQYAPEELPRMAAPIIDGSADVVFGSRMLNRSQAREGGMPLYKYVGNIFLTTVQNWLVGTNLSEWHSGYRAYRVSALASIDLDHNSDEFDFDTQIILQMIASGQRIREIEIPTFYGEEISHVNSVKYGLQILRHTIRYRLAHRH